MFSAMVQTFRFLSAFAITGALTSAVVASLADAVPSGTEVYDAVWSVLSGLPNRRVGSDGFKTAAAAVEGPLSARGLAPHRETFASLAQRTERCNLAFGGVPVPGALLIDAGPAAFPDTAVSGPIEGPAVYVGAGSLRELDGKKLDGAFAVIDCTLPGASVRESFAHGAAAVALVGGPELNPWTLGDVAFESVTHVPRVYVPREAAEAAGLLSADGTALLSLDARAELSDVVGENLWFVLPGREGSVADLDGGEVVLLSATLDTYGLTPEFSPDLRSAANCALLAQVAADMAAGPPPARTVVFAFFGSRHAAQEGARFFYHAIEMADGGRTSLSLESRLNDFTNELARTEALLAASEDGDVLVGRGEPVRALRLRLKKDLSFLSGDIRSALAAARESRAAAKVAPGVGGGAAEKDGGGAASDAEIGALEERRMACNELRSLLVRGGAAERSAAADALLEERLECVRATLRVRADELRSFAAHCATWMELSSVFSERHLVFHLDFDFAAPDRPWMLSMMGANRLFRHGGTDVGSYGRHLSAVRSVYYGDQVTGSRGISEGRDWGATLWEPALTPTWKPFSLSLPRQRITPTDPAAALGVAAFEALTVGDPLRSDNLPLRVPCDLRPLSQQMHVFCRALAESPAFSLRPVYPPHRSETRLLGTSGEGLSYQDWAPGSTDAQGPPPRAIANFPGVTAAAPLPGVGLAPRARIQANGRVYVPLVSRDFVATPWLFHNVAVGYDENGAPDRVTFGGESDSIPATPVHLFRAYGGLAWCDGFAPDESGGDLYHAETLVARKDSPHKTKAVFTFDDPRGGRKEFFADRPDPVKVIGSHGDMLLGSREPAPGEDRVAAAMGDGVPIAGAARLRADDIARGARDVCLLDDARLSVLRSRNIVRDDLEKLHADALEHAEEAADAASKRQWSLARAHDIFAACLENRIYRPLRGVTEDLVQAVVVLLLLAIPFAFAMERLLCGFTSVYRQVAGFTGFFLATFGLLYATHPAFSLASAPSVVFLAFVIIVLGVATTAVMAGKIREEIRKLQGLSSTAHGIQSESSTTLSAILIGMAGMRNRPLKTFLTCITVVLLTFTILVFASFTGSLGVVETPLGRGAGADRIELHRLSMLPMDTGFCDAVATLSGPRYHVVRRGGVFKIPTRQEDSGATTISPERVFWDPVGCAAMQVSAVMGVDPGDAEVPLPGLAATQQGEGASAHPDGSALARPVWLAPVATNVLRGLTVGSELRLGGTPFHFAGFFDPVAFQGATTIDGLKLTPPDFQATLQASGQSGDTATIFEQMGGSSFEWISPEMIAIARQDDLRAAFGDACVTTSLVLYPRDAEESVQADAERLAPAFVGGTVLAKSPRGATRMIFANAVKGSGFADVAVPLLLGGLIIFSSLMGSIVAREKEIFTYSALGLAPVDVGALFFAESAVYSVVGGMGGYLLGQLSAKILSMCAARGWFTAPEMNFSSLSSVCTILVVMAVVMLSTVFPAARAGRSANPGVARKWKMPRPDGDRLHFTFPFTVSSQDFSGILAFIREHFENHSDATLGNFAAHDARIVRGADGAAAIEAEISLAPFDLGLFQTFRMQSSPSDIPGIDEVVVDIRREGGSPEAWQRSNRRFAAELREQFLLWRSLPVATVEHYRAESRK